MATIIFLFAILSTPTDRIICDLWTRSLTLEAYNAACPSAPLANHRVDVYSLDGQLLCSRPAASLNNITAECGLQGALDTYRLRIVEPAFSELLCMVESESNTEPDARMIAEQCPGVGTDYIIKASGTRSTSEAGFYCPARHLPLGYGLFDQASAPSEIVTRDELNMLAGQLIWNGHVKVTTCQGEAGVTKNKLATPCGYLSAHDDVILWQNQFNTEIFNAAHKWAVPARLLKRMIMIESQFWPFYNGAAGEIGIMQITDNGLDTLLRFDRSLDPLYLRKSDDGKLWSRYAAREIFMCRNCNIHEAIDHIKITMDYYARLLAAFHCRAVTINPALTGADEWRQTVVDYNGSGEYLLRIEQ